MHSLMKLSLTFVCVSIVNEATIIGCLKVLILFNFYFNSNLLSSVVLISLSLLSGGVPADVYAC